MDRIEKLSGYLHKCTSFADVACDHGYIAEYMLRNGLCERAVVSDISPKCLKKAENLLLNYISAGKCRAVCCDGLEKVGEADFAVIAGIGGEEIIRILKNGYIPETFLFQPMKNAPALRAYLLENGCTFTADDIFTDGKKYYFVIGGGRGKAEKYSEAELLYGRDSLKNPVFYGYLRLELKKNERYLHNRMTEGSRADIMRRIKLMEEILKNDPDGNT